MFTVVIRKCYGMAGMGKSTIARTLARDWDGQGKLGASFFFSRGGGDRSQSKKLFTTLSFYLAKASPIIERSICHAIREHRDPYGDGPFELTPFDGGFELASKLVYGKRRIRQAFGQKIND